MTDTSPWLAVLLLLAAAAVVIGVFAAHRRAKQHTLALRERFGPEYDRAVQEHGVKYAEKELEARSGRVGKLHFRDLSEAERTKYGALWSRIQAQFVDDPATAAVRASELITDVMRARGYPTDDFEQQAADLSVDHAEVVQHYRAAEALAHAEHAGAVETEDLRQALVHYRTLFADLVQVPAVMAR